MFYNNKVIIKGINKLKGNTVTALDLRGGFSLLMGALLIDEVSIINNDHFIKRGYEDFINRLVNLGAIIYEEDYFI